VSQVDRVLAVLDVGLQSSTETGYTTDHSPSRCSRCQVGSVDDGDLCGDCRAYLLGDTAEDPIERQHYLNTQAIYEAARARTNREGLPVIGGIIDGQWVAAEGHHMEVPIFRSITAAREAGDPLDCIIERDLYRREAFHMRDALMWAWVHTSLTGEQAARRLVDLHIDGS
jgi:hypothetical protein